ncbi:MAG: hypothetical protein WCD11_26965, partial [Solirubrobacteraceae bacterium]
MAATRAVVALVYEDGALRAIDQTELPWREVELELHTAEDVAGAIRRLAIRGAPLIGVAAAYGVAIELASEPTPDTLDRAAELLRSARPTAVNLSRAVDRVTRAARGATDPYAAALAEARAIEA